MRQHGEVKTVRVTDNRSQDTECAQWSCALTDASRDITSLHPVETGRGKLSSGEQGGSQLTPQVTAGV